MIDLSMSLAAQPHAMAGLVTIMGQPQAYGVVVLAGASAGWVSPRWAFRDVNPILLFGMMLLAASTIAAVPIALGLGVLGMAIALSVGATLGGEIRWMMRDGMVRHAHVTNARWHAFKRAYGPVLYPLTATGRMRLSRTAVPIILLGGICLALGCEQIGFLLMVVATGGFIMQSRLARSLLWSNARRAHRRWSLLSAPN